MKPRIQWNAPGTKPAAPGIFRKRADRFNVNYAYWDGKLWYGCVHRVPSKSPLASQEVEWAPTATLLLTEYERGRRAGMREALNMSPDELNEICGGFEE